MSYGDDFVLTMFTNDPHLASRADAAGIDRIGLDLEYIDKAQRQAGLKSWISDHQIDDLEIIADSLSQAQLFVRTNPIHDQLQQEIDEYINRGAKVLMLPMVRSTDQAAQFVQCVEGRAKVSLLVETAAGAARLHEIVRIAGIHEIHIGLNDMHLAMGLQSHFEVLASDLIESMSTVVRDAGIAFGFGGIGRYEDERLPISSDLVYSQYPYLNADRALVSRVFVTPDWRELDLAHEVGRFRSRMDHWRNSSPETLMEARQELRTQVRALLDGRRVLPSPKS